MTDSATGQGLPSEKIATLTVLDNADRHRDKETGRFGPFPQRKRFTPEGEEPIPKGFRWLWEERQIASFDDLATTLEEIASDPSGCKACVTGRVRDAVRDRKKIMRRLRQQDGTPGTFEEVGSAVLHFDVDDLAFPEPYGWHDPEALARWTWAQVVAKLPALDGVAVWWQASNSAGTKGKRHLAKFHFWLLVDDPLTPRYRKAIYEHGGADRAISRTVQLSYVAPPEFEGVPDPLAGVCRSGRFAGADRANAIDLVACLPAEATKVAPPPAPRPARPRFSGTPTDFESSVASFNAAHDLASELERYGWTGGPVHYQSPFQTSQSFATRVYPEGYAISLSDSDASQGFGRETPSGALRFDAFELFAHFEHGGDRGAAARAWQAYCTPRDTKGRWMGSTALVTDSPALLPDFVTVAEAGDRIKDAVRRFVKDKPPVMAIAASPGAGKSRHAREVLAEALPTLGGDLAYYCPTLELAEEAAEHFAELGVQAVAVRGRLATDTGREDKLTEGDEGLMCLRPNLVRTARNVGLAEGQNVCKRGRGLLEERCPHWNQCPWVQQWAVPEGPIVRCMAHNYLHLPDGSGRGAPALHVVDEACWQGAIGKGEVSIADWLQERSPAGFGAWDLSNFEDQVAKAADMLAAAREVLPVLQDGGSLQGLRWTAEDFREFAKAEDTRPMLGLGPGSDDTQLQDKLAGMTKVDKHAGKRAAIWRVLAEALEAGRDRSERVLVRDDKLVVHWRKEMPTGPTLHLDADADAVILGALYPAEAEIEIVKAELRPRAEVVQVTDKTFSKRALLGTEDKPAGAGLRKELRGLVLTEVMRDRAQNGGGVLCVASKQVVERLFEDAGQKASLGAELWGARWIWFGPASKGLNDWRDFGTVIELGREELPPSAIEDQARGLWGDGAEPLVMPEADEHGNVQVPQAVLPVLMADGSAKGLQGRAYADSRLRALQVQTRENSGRQAAERLRMAHGVMPKRWLRLNTVPLATAPVDRLVTWAEMVPDRLQTAVAEAAQAKGFLRLSGKGLAEDAAGTFANVKVGERWLESYTPQAPSKDSIRGVGGITAKMRRKGQRGPNLTTVIIPAVTCPEAAKALIERELGPLVHFEVLETVPTPADHAVNEQVKRLESIAKAIGYRPKVTVKPVESPVFVAGQIPARGMLDALERRGWPVELVPG